jgi:hypothetical protein
MQMLRLHPAPLHHNLLFNEVPGDGQGGGGGVEGWEMGGDTSGVRNASEKGE